MRSPNSDAARRDDLCRWGRLFGVVTRRAVSDGRLVLAQDLAGLSPGDLTVGVVEKALAHAEVAYAPATVRRMMSTLRSFTRFLVARGVLEVDPCLGETLQLPAAGALEPKALASEDVERLLVEAARPVPSTSFWPERDQVLVLLLGWAGLRLSEAVGASWEWVDERAERPLLHVVGKGGRRRVVPLGGRIVEALNALRVAVAARGLPVGDRDRMLVTASGRAWSRQYADLVLRSLAQRSGVTFPESAAAHSLRHHFGTVLALRGVDLNVISQLLGHADPRTSQRYTLLASRHLISALDDAGML